MTKVTHRSFCVAAVISLGVMAFRAPGAEKAATAMSEEALFATFESAIRNLTINWDPTDPRPVDERLKAFSTFMYQTYDASAWIPQSLLDSNVITQAVAGDVETIIRERVGLVLWPDNPHVPAFGTAIESCTGLAIENCTLGGGDEPLVRRFLLCSCSLSLRG